MYHPLQLEQLRIDRALEPKRRPQPVDAPPARRSWRARRRGC